MSRNPSYRMKRARNVAAATLVLTGCLPVAFAQDAASTGNSGALETVIVTATKRAENLQEVPVAVSAVTASELESRSITETSDLMGAMPNLQVTSAYGRTQPNFSLRGISVANEFSAATASPVGVYVDEVYQSFRASHGQQLYDLEQVEVVRGPQGTLFGRNTTGGAISFTTKKPQLDGTDAYASFGAGRFDAIETAGAVEITPIQDQLGFRLAGTYSRADGYTFNPVDGEDYGGTNSKAARLSARYKPTDNLDVNFKGYFARNNPRQDLPFGVSYLANGNNVANQPISGAKEPRVAADTAGNYFTSAGGATLSLDYKLSDSVSLTSISGFDTAIYRLSPFDCDASPTDLCAIRYDSQSKNINQELRFSFDNGSRFKAVGGLYYGMDTIDSHNEPDFFGFVKDALLAAGAPADTFNPPIGSLDSTRIQPAFARPGFNGPPPPDPAACAPVEVNPNGIADDRALIAFVTDVANTNSQFPGPAQMACAAAGAPSFTNIDVDQFYTLERPSYAIYGEGKYELTDRSSLTVGLRYTYDEVKFKDVTSVVKDIGGNVRASLVPFVADFDGTGPTPKLSDSENTGEVTGRLIYDYKWTDDVLTYASYSHGYRAGTYNSLAYQSVDQVYFVEPEIVDAFEIGVKSRLFDDRVQLNAAAFFYDYENQQIAQIVGATSFLVSANGEVKGAEAELIAQVADAVRFDLSLGLLDTEYDDNQTLRGGGLDIGGNEFPNAPKVTANLGVDWRIWQNSVGQLSLRSEVQYMGRYFFDPFNDYDGNRQLASKQLADGNPAYELYNARLTYDMDNLSVSAWGKNLGNKFYYVYGLNLQAFNQDYFTRGTPRTFGVDATYRF